MARKFRIAVGLLFLAIFLTSVLAVPLAVAHSSPPKQLRCRVVKRTPRYLFVKHSHPGLHLKLHKAQHYTKIRGHRYKIVKRSHHFIVLRAKARKPRKPLTPPVPPTPTPTAIPTPSPTVTPTVTPTPTVSPSPTPTPTPTVTPSPTPTVTPSPTPSPTPTPTVSPTPTVTDDSPDLVLTATAIVNVRTAIAAGQQPYYDAWSNFRGRVTTAMSSTPDVFVGPEAVSGNTSAIQDMFDKDGKACRNLALGYALSGQQENAEKAREYLLAWAQGNHPSTVTDMGGDALGGTYVSHGLFMFAFAYDLTKSSRLYTPADRELIETWFRAWADDLTTFLAATEASSLFSDLTKRSEYEWSGDSGLTYLTVERSWGGDRPALTLVAQLALAIESGYTEVLDRLLNPGSTYTFTVAKVIQHGCAPDNDGDGQGTAPVPQVNILKAGANDNPGRGGCVDYMTYNQRAQSILYEMAANQGKATQTERDQVYRSWVYLSRYFGSDAVPSPAPNDVIAMDVSLPRMQQALHLFGDARFADDVAGQTALWEPHFLGPTILTQP